MPGPKPTSIKVLEGGRGHRTKSEKAKQANEPKPRPILPDKPPYLSETASKRWDELLPELDYSGVLTRVDGDILAGYCMAYADVVSLTKVIKNRGRTYTVGTNGAVSARPEIAMLNRAKDDLRKFGAELGIGAAARTKVEVNKADAKKDPVEDLAARAAARRRGR